MNGSESLRRRGAAIIACGIVPFVFLVAISLAAVDFGSYWDDDAMATKVRRAIAPPLTLLPAAYDYPSVSFWVALAAIVPEALHEPRLLHRVPDTSRLDAFTYTEAFRLRMRRMFALLSTVTVFWVAGLSLAVGGRRWEAALAASLFAAFWESGYTIRWVAPDGMLTQFTVAAVMFATMSLEASSPQRRWRLLVGAAVMAGLATGSKYSAWPAVLPVSLAGWINPRPGQTKPASAIRLLLAAMLAFFVVSPGILLQPTLAVGQILWQVAHYATGHGAYTVTRGIDHFARIVIYSGAVLGSPYRSIALATAAAAAAGVFAMLRRSPAPALVVLVFPVVYLLYFSSQRVMLARNLIVFAPFLAVFAARGVGWAWDAVPLVGWLRTGGRPAVASIAVFAIAANVIFQISAVESIRNRSADRTLREFADWRKAQPEGSVELSPRLQVEAGPQPAVIRADADLAMYAREPGHEGFAANERLTFKKVFGPRDVNMNYYPDWPGDEHIVVVSRERAIRFGLIAN